MFLHIFQTHGARSEERAKPGMRHGKEEGKGFASLTSGVGAEVAFLLPAALGVLTPWSPAD